jgi:transcriptional regulator with XRE-family HTH domain
MFNWDANWKGMEMKNVNSVEVAKDNSKAVDAIGKNISKKRKQLGLTQAQLAEKLGVETETLSRIERGKNIPSLSTLEKISTHLSISVAEMLVDPLKNNENDIFVIAGLLSELSSEDRSFVVALIKKICNYQKIR